MVLNLNLGTVESKTALEVQNMRVGGLIWQAIRDYLSDNVRAGMSLFDVEALAKEQFMKYGVEPSFNKKGDFPSIVCLSLNNCVVHGSSSKEIIQPGDKLTIDLGFIYNGMNLDAAFSLFFEFPEEIQEGEKKEKKAKNSAEAKELAFKKKRIEEYKYLQQLTIAMFYESIESLKAGKTTGFITEKLESFFKKYFPKKYSFLEKFTGHGIGKELHEFPRIYNFGLASHEGVPLPVNSTICIEPMIVEQKDGFWVQEKNDHGIYIKNKNGMTLHYEHVVLILEDGVEVLTASLWELKEMKSSWKIVKSIN